MKLTNKVVVITGAAGCLGRALERTFAPEGAKLALIDNTDLLARENLQPHARHYCCDITQEAQVESTIASIEHDFGHIDALINNAAVMLDALLIKAKDAEVTDKMSLHDWQKVLDVNLTGTFLCTREAAAVMVRHQRSGVILNVSSVSKHGNFGQGNYAASKAGVEALTVTWAKELARHNIRVVAMAPGIVDSPLTRSIPEKNLQQLVQATTSKRLAHPDEIAHAMKFALENDYFCGRTLSVDGGLRL